MKGIMVQLGMVCVMVFGVSIANGASASWYSGSKPTHPMGTDVSWSNSSNTLDTTGYSEYTGGSVNNALRFGFNGEYNHWCWKFVRQSGDISAYDVSISTQNYYDHTSDSGELNLMTGYEDITTTDDGTGDYWWYASSNLTVITTPRTTGGGFSWSDVSASIPADKGVFYLFYNCKDVSNSGGYGWIYRLDVVFTPVPASGTAIIIK